MSAPKFFFLCMSGPPGTIDEEAYGVVYFDKDLEKVLGRLKEFEVLYGERKFDIREEQVKG